MRYELKSVGIWSVTKISFFFNLIGGLIFGLIYGVLASFMLAVADQIPGAFGSGLDPDDLSAGMLIVVLPLMFSICGAIFGTMMSIIMAGLYNVIARMIGGLEFNFSVIEASATSQPEYSCPAAAPLPPVAPVAVSPPPPPMVPPPPAAPIAPFDTPTEDGLPTKLPGGEPEPDRDQDDPPSDESRLP